MPASGEIRGMYRRYYIPAMTLGPLGPAGRSALERTGKALHSWLSISGKHPIMSRGEEPGRGV